MNITRRKFFFGLAGGIGLMLPKNDIKLSNDDLRMYFNDDILYNKIGKKSITLVSYREMRIPLQLRPGGHFTWSKL